MRKTRYTLAVLCLGALLSACTALRPPGYDLPSADGLVPGEEITVGRNENLYAVAQKHGVRLREIIVLNDLKPPYVLRSGQTLVLPSKDKYAAPTPKAAPLEHIDKGYMGPTSNGAGGASGVTAVPLEPPSLPGKSSSVPSASSSVTTAPSSLTGGSVSSAPLTAPTVTKTTTYTGAPQPAPQGLTQEPVAPAAAPVPEPVTTSSSTPKTVASVASAAPPAKAATSSASFPTFGWPVRGTVISAFGPKGQGLDNDGLNIAAPKGSPVKAAEGGIVAYAGNEMKGFGNLVLIRHEGGWVTAYAHLERMVVARDSTVAKGDMIGTVGNTGGVGSPQLHFEARQDGRPVDPELVLK